MEDRKSLIRWIKGHKKQLIIAGISIGTLILIILGIKNRAAINALRRYQSSFAETLVQLMKERKLSNKKLADLSLVGEKTIQRLRNDEEYKAEKCSVQF